MIAIVVPTDSQEKIEKFKEEWKSIIDRHLCELVVVQDGPNPTVNGESAEEIMGEYASVLTNLNPGIRNLGFAYVAKLLKECEVIITLDDNVKPIGDPVQDHIDTLYKRVPVSWFSTASEYTKGFPYSVREEAEVVVSQGICEGSGDWDAPTQLVTGGAKAVTYYKGPIPKGTYYPMRSVNLAFKRKALPYMFQAPCSDEVRGFEDIFSGVVSKRKIDEQGWAVVSGYASVNRDVTSNPLLNLKDEAYGIVLNETFWKGEINHPYFKDYQDKLQRWQDFISSTENLESTEDEPEVVEEQEKQPETVKPPTPFDELPTNSTENVDDDSANTEEEEKVPEISEPETETNEERENNGIEGELHFWRGWLQGHGRYFAKTRHLSERFNYALGDKQEVTIADLGAGAISMIGNYRPDIKINVIASDILADEYTSMWKEYGLNPVTPLEKQDMAKLTYPNDSFDIVFCGNSLDHSNDPYNALKEMVRVCKPGGYIHLRHIAHEGKRHNYRNMHYWNIDITENGDCVFWSDIPEFQDKKFLLSDIYPGFKTISEQTPKATLITSIVQKT